MMAYPAWIFLF